MKQMKRDGMLHRKSVVAGCLFVGWLAGMNVVAADYYVATTGNDTNSGSFSAPFQTLEKAQWAVRAELPSATTAIHVWVREGTYYLDETLEFGIADSGSSAVPVMYSGYSNETVVISGAIPLTPNWSIDSGNIQVADIGSGLSFDMLFVDHDLQVLARYPNYEEDTAILNGYASDAISSSKVSEWADPSGGFVRGLHGSRWGGNSYKITGKSGTSLNMEWVGDNNRGGGIHATYRMVENIFEELDAEGEWFYDESDGKLYFYPPSGMDLSAATIEAASLEELIRVVGDADTKVSYLTFRNFTFTGTHRTLFTRDYEPMNRSDWQLARAGTIFIQDAEHITVSDSIFDRIGGNGVFMSAYNRNHLIHNNEFLDNGATCVNVCGSTNAYWGVNNWDDYPTTTNEIAYVEGPKTDDYPKDITISLNYMYNMGRFEKQTSGVNVFLAESITISSNTIHHCPRAGINICDGAWGGHIIEHNDVFDCIRETNDHGPFNSWGRDRFYSINGYQHSGQDGEIKRPYAFLEAWKTTHIRHNRFHYDEPTEFGIDLDDGSSNYEIYNNLILNTSVKLREGFERKVYNNIIINRGLDLHVWYAGCRDSLSNNIIVSSSAYHPISVGGSDEEAFTDYNLFYNGGEEVDVDTFNWTGSDEHSVTANPLFINPSSNNYTVATNSPALALGFKNFSMEFGKPGAPEPGPIEYNAGIAPNSDAEPLMGAYIASIYEDALQSVLGAPDMNGIFFEELPDGCYAAGQGFEKYDLIRAVNGIEVTTKQSFWLIYNSIEAGSIVEIERFRNQDSEDFYFVKTDGYERLNNTAGILYTGTWSTQQFSSCFNGDVRQTETAGDAFEITFYGSDVAIETMTSATQGDMEIYMDGELDQTVSGYSASTRYQQTIYSKTDLSAGLHTLRGVNVENKTMTLDSMRVGTLPDMNWQVSTSQSATNAPSVSANDLAQVYYLESSATGGDAVAERHGELFNGVVGDTESGTSDSGVIRMDSDNTITVVFDTSVHTLGYDLTGISTIFGWNPDGGGRSNQGYELILFFVNGSEATLAGPEHWEPNNPATYWTTVSFTPEGTHAAMASGVKSVTFDITQNANASGVLIAREFDIFGVPTVDPNAPPTTNIIYTTRQSDTAPTVSTNDLAQTYYASSSGSGGNEASQHAQLFNGLIGNEDDDTHDEGEVSLTSDNAITVTFDTSVHTHGYNIREISTYFGWDIAGNGRSNQGYELILTYVDGTTKSLAGPEHWQPNLPASYWTTVTFTEEGGGVMASGVKSVTFDISEDANANGVVIAREFDIFGSPTVSDEDYIAAFIPSETRVSNGYFVTQFSGVIGAEYTVEWNSNLMHSNRWTTATNIQSLENSPFEIVMPATNRADFYRVRWIQ
ncbi:MAG: hypothetical protein V5783_06675 [Pontiella sp.]